MKKHFLKSFALLAMLFSALTLSAQSGVDWSTISWIGSTDATYNEKFKCSTTEGLVNIQKPFGDEIGIYMTFPTDVDLTCNLSGFYKQGAGLLLYLSSFTAQETQVVATWNGGSRTFWVYYADGAEGGGETPSTPTEIYDVNFALASNGSSAEATSGDATAAIDNNPGTRWESAQTDPQTWTLDLGQARIFNTLEIVWEGAYGKTFTVSVSDDKATWTPVWTVEGQELAGFPYTQTQKIDKTTARYIQFHGTERGTGYGYSFWEFRVYLAGESTFTSLEATPTTNLSKVGEGNAITLTPKDQNGKTMTDVGEVTYTITPADAGTITNNVYTPARIGLASIVATIGEVSAPAFEVFAYDGENVALSPDINNSKIVAQSDFAPNGTDAWHAIDGNDGSVWQGSATNGTANDEDSRTYNSWFVVDFGGYYDINLVTIQFEGACSQEYTVAFSADNATWATAYEYVGNAGVYGHTKFIYGNDLQNTTKVRYARFYSTKAATEWGMKIFEFKVFGTPWVAPEDDVKPVMGTATLVSKNGNSVVIAVSATDNTNIKGYRVKEGTYNKIVLPNGEGNITVDNLEYGSHTLTITAIDEANNESDNNVSVEFTLEVPEITDVNFALTTQGASATASEGNAVEAIDDNMGTRWGTGESDPHWWVVDLGQLRIFNTIQIVWEGAYGKTFTIETSSDNSDWDLAATITDQELAGFPYTQTINIDKTTARYVRFNGTARGTQYGYSFWEFRVYLAGASILTSLAAQPASNLTKLGESNAITITPKDQNGTIMADAGEVVYTITPADAGTITNNIYTPAKVGVATIVAAIGEVKAEAFDVIAYEGENIALSTNMATDNKIYAQSSPSEGAANAFFAIDENDNGVWRGAPTEANTGTDEASRTYDAWFVVDFGAYYDINLVTIKFENACSQKYHVDFSEDATNWNTTYNYEGNAGWNAHTACIAGSDLQNATKVRYARFYSTMAATEFGVQIYSFKVFGTPYVAAGDTEKPVMGTATLVSKTHKSAIIAVSATDNDEVGSYHVVCTNPAYEQTLTPTEGQITLTGLTAATAYNFTITAIDLAGNESENAATVECTTNIYNAKPTSAPTPPTHDAKQVKSVFSDVYGGTFSAMEGWGQATQFEELNFNGDYVRYYTNLNYLGWATGSPINASVMEKLHLDIWAAEDATIIIVPIYGGQGLVTDDQKTKTVTLKGQEWNSIDLTLATDFAGLNLSSIFQFKFDAPQGTDKFAIDNVYFYTTQVSSDVTPPANLTVTAVPSFTTAVINCQATDLSGSISYEVYFGEELKGTGSADSGKTASITVTNLQPNREFTMTVIATDVYGNKSPEAVDVTFTTLAYPDPAPTPIWKEENVFSIYSDAYTTTVNRAFGWGWGASTVEAEVELAASDKALQYTTSNYAGWELNGSTTIGDLNEYPYLHMDIYVEKAGSIQFTPIWGAEALKTYTLKAGWNSIDIDLVAEFIGINLANIYQLKWAAMPATCFIDNVYFYKEVHQKVTESLEITEDYAYTSLTITEDGKVTISNDATLIVKDFVIQSTMGAGESGQLLGATLDNFDLIGDAYIDITLGKDAAADQWHAFTVPFPVNALNGIYKTDGTKLRNEVDYAIMDYHGDIRANGKYGWKKYRGDLVPGTFYIMTVNGDIKTFRFKKTDGSSVVAANNKDLVAHNGSGTDTDKGWNGVGNPTLAYGSVAQAVQVLNPETYTYEAHEANATNFTVGTPFFIQAASNGNMTMAVADASKPSYAPARQQTTEMKAKVYLSNDNYTDRLYITATDDATATYEIGKDLVKMTMTNTPNVPQIFARAYNTDLCMIHTPLSNNEAMVALNLYAPAAGEYTLSAEAQNDETIYLLKDNAIIWNLTASEYTIDLSQGNTEVYGVIIKRAPQVETGIDNGATIQTLPSKVILQGNLYILHNGQMYDATGKCVK